MLKGVLLLLAVLVVLDGLVLWHVLRVEGAVAPLMRVGEGPPETPLAGKPAPAFALPDLQGKEVSLAQFRGKEVLLVFASTECGVCQKMFPYLGAFHQEHPEQTIVMVLKGGQQAREEVAKENGFDFPVLAWDDEVARAYKVPGTPWFFVVDEEGKVRRSGTANTLERITAFALGQ